MKITSKDGTQIAYDKTGKGPALILVDGAFAYRENGNTKELAKLLADHFTVYDYDRRGRGESADTQPYSVDREIEDLKALIEASGESPFVCAFSSGCGLVLQTVHKGQKFKKIVLYEPPYVAIHKEDELPVREVKSEIEKLISEGEKAKAVKYFLKRVVRVPAIFIFFFRFFNRSGWKKNEGVVRTLPYDLEVMGDLAFPPGLASKNVSPVLVIGGEKSPQSLIDGVKNVATHVPNSETLFLKGQTHNVSVKVLAPELIRFFK
jgi:pimeloyl-ACP methyl ester carboxylesterase